MTESKRIELIERIKKLIEKADQFKSCYLWNKYGNYCPGNAASRKWYEKKHSMPEFSWTENGSTYSAEFEVIARCNRVEAHGIYTRDGKKTTLTTIKNSLKRLEKPGQ